MTVAVGLGLPAGAFASGSTGGVAAGSAVSITTPSAHRRPNKRRHPRHRPSTYVLPPGAAPITATSSNIAYSGPVYERTATGQVVPYTTQTPQTVSAEKALTGGSPVGVVAAARPQLLVPGHVGHIIDGYAAAPMSAPPAVQNMIWAANQIIGLPYIYCGGHASFSSPGYDCSGTVSFALHGAGLLSTPMDSSEFEGWSAGGPGMWVTVFANGGHAYMTVAGLRLDTSSADDPSNQQGPRWRPLRPANAGFVVRHPAGL